MQMCLLSVVMALFSHSFYKLLFAGAVLLIEFNS